VRLISAQVMELGECDLSKLLKLKLEAQNAPLDLSFTRYYWKEMLECVQAVHDYDIVHSDLKPANFLLVQGSLKLIDFGIAGAIDTDNTVNVHRDTHVGTPNYMSPESLEDTNAGARGPGVAKLMKIGKPSDVWSLGCILYQMVYGKPPFAHIAQPFHRVMAIVNPSVHISYPTEGIGGVTVPPSLRNTLKSCLQRDATKRPTIPQLLSDTDPFLNPDSSADLRIPLDLLNQIIQRVADRFRDKEKKEPTDEEIMQYGPSFYARIRRLVEEG
jgi:serine/threonine-protein kinase TTK/MPS1